MTPTAVTPAARTKRPGATRPRSDQSGPHPSSPRVAHRAGLTRTTAPRAPRRVSGPLAPSVGQPSALPRGPVRPRPSRAERPRRASPVAGDPLLARVHARLRTLPDHALLDRVVRGRLWIPLLGILLAGIVATQVEVLKLNASIGHSVVSASALQSENQTLRAEASRLGEDQRIEQEATSLDMRMPPATQPLYLGGSTSANLAHALANIHAPDPTAFVAQTSARASRRAAAVVYSSGQ